MKFKLSISPEKAGEIQKWNIARRNTGLKKQRGLKFKGSHTHRFTTIINLTRQIQLYGLWKLSWVNNSLVSNKNLKMKRSHHVSKLTTKTIITKNPITNRQQNAIIIPPCSLVPIFSANCRQIKWAKWLEQIDFWLASSCAHNYNKLVLY